MRIVVIMIHAWVTDEPFRRVCEVELLGNHEFVLRQQKYKVSEALKTGEATTLFGMFPD